VILPGSWRENVVDRKGTAETTGQGAERSTATKGQGAEIGPNTGQGPKAKKGHYSQGQGHTGGQDQDPGK
jgi:hypothetical protein